LASLPTYTTGDTSELAQLTAAARLCVNASLDVRSRYSQMRAIVDSTSPGIYAPYVHLELGFLGWWIDLSRADQDFAACENEPGDLASSARFVRATTAFRLSKFREVTQFMQRQHGSRMDLIRSTDVLGHVYMHNAEFGRAADLFLNAANLAEGEVPLFFGRAKRHLALAYAWFDPD